MTNLTSYWLSISYFWPVLMENYHCGSRSNAFLFDVPKLPLYNRSFVKRPCQNKTPCWLRSFVQLDDRGSVENTSPCVSHPSNPCQK